MPNFEGLVGPSADEREREAIPSLEGGTPMYHALLDSGPEGNVSAAEVHEAKNRLQALEAYDPEAVAACVGMPIEEARKRLESIQIPEDGEVAA